MSNDREESLQDLNMKVPPEWHTVIKVASARVGISIRAFLLMSAAHMLNNMASDPAIRSVMPATTAWSTSSEERFRAFCTSLPRSDNPASEPSGTGGAPDGNQPDSATPVTATLPERLTRLVARQATNGKSIAQIAA